MAVKKGVKLDPYSWEFTQKMIRVGHNRRVRNYFKDVQADDSKASGRTAIKSSLLIRDEDSAIETLNKMTYFANYLERDNVVALPDGWQIKKGQDIPQLAIIFRPVDKKNKSGDYTIHVPHHNGSKNVKALTYSKGNHWARWILKDNSHIVVNGKTEAEALRVIEALEKNVEPKFRSPKDQWLVTGTYTGKPFKEIKVTPLRADFYKTGKAQIAPDWRSYFNSETKPK